MAPQFSQLAAAFVASPASPGRKLLSTVPTQSWTTLSTSLRGAPVMDFTNAALGFFSGVRIPSALIAGSSLGAFFSLIDLAKDSEHKTYGERILIRCYHILFLMSLALSLNVVITSTVAGTTLLLGHHDTMATSAYEFLNREMLFEFVSTRWSFLVSLLSFIGGVTTRALLEFDLLNKNRRRASIVLVLSMSTLLSHLLSYINGTLINWPNLGVMTLSLLKMTLHRAATYKKPLEIFSIVCFVGTLISAPWALAGFGNVPKKDDSDSSSLQ